MEKYGIVFYQSLFKPFEKSFVGAADIIIVPDGPLASIPFESFVIDDSNPNRPVYLLEKYRLRYLPSATTLSMIRTNHRGGSNSKSFIGFGDPVYDYENFKQGKPERGNFVLRARVPVPPGKITKYKLQITNKPQAQNYNYQTEEAPYGQSVNAGGEVLVTETTEDTNTNFSTSIFPGDEIKGIHRGKYEREGGLLDRLPGSGEEVNVIADLFNKNGGRAVVHLRGDAAEEIAKGAGMNKFDYIHFSCHGVLGENYQGLVLSQIPQAKEDGYLTLNEIMNCDYNARLVVLSACQTGSGKMERAEGVTGLTRAVMYAGTPAVVASLWNVSEKGTKELMVRFYRDILKRGMRIEEALRSAKLELMQSKGFSSPFYWSAFVLYGDGGE